MSKRKDRRRAAALYGNLTHTVQATSYGEEPSPCRHGSDSNHADTPIADSILAQSETFACVLKASPYELPKMKKFRFQLLHQWILDHIAPCRVADVGGGKGLLGYLLHSSGFPATVIDPVSQRLPSKYKDPASDKQVRIAGTEQVARIDRPFAPEMTRHFDLLIAMHAHGCNIQVIDAAAQYDRQAILLPCCIIEEPITPPSNVHWLICLADYAIRQGFEVKPFRLNFKGQNIGLYLHRQEDKRGLNFNP